MDKNVCTLDEKLILVFWIVQISWKSYSNPNFLVLKCNISTLPTKVESLLYQERKNFYKEMAEKTMIVCTRVQRSNIAEKKQKNERLMQLGF